MRSVLPIPDDEFAALRREARAQRASILKAARRCLAEAEALALDGTAEARADTKTVNTSLLLLLNQLKKHGAWADESVLKRATGTSNRLVQYAQQQRDAVIQAEQAIARALDESQSRGSRANAVLQLVERLVHDLERIDTLAETLRASTPSHYPGDR